MLRRPIDYGPDNVHITIPGCSLYNYTSRPMFVGCVIACM